VSRDAAPVADAMRHRHSQSRVTDEAPRIRDLVPLVEAAGSVADHSSLRPWRIIVLRGEARERLGAAMAEAAGLEGEAASGLARKPLRAPMLLAVVVSPKPSIKVPDWEQEAVASGVAHALTLLLDEAGWGVIWRTGLQTRSEAVARMHGLGPGERLLGWLYVGGRHERGRGGRRRAIGARELITKL
jgi:nitroreductase